MWPHNKLFYSQLLYIKLLFNDEQLFNDASYIYKQVGQQGDGQLFNDAIV